MLEIYVGNLNIECYKIENKGLPRKKTIKPRKKKLTKIDMLKTLKKRRPSNLRKKMSKTRKITFSKQHFFICFLM